MDVFVTGTTGLLGQKFIKQINQRTDITRIYALVRDIHKGEKVLLKQDKTTKKIHLIKGNVKEKNLGLHKEEIKKLSNVEEVYHLAALVHLGKGEKVKKKLEETNIQGTKNVLSILKHMPKLQRFLFISTAYSAGVYKNKIPEKWLQKPKEFRNPYEKTKWECEKQIKEAFKKSKVTYMIIRPSILLDTPDNTEIQKHTVYLFVKLMHYYTQFINEEFILVGNPESRLNFVFVEDLITTMIQANKEKKSQIYNLATTNISIKQLAELFKKTLNIKKDIVFTKKEPEIKDKLKEQFIRKTRAFTPYLTKGTMNWSTNNTTALFNKLHGNMKGEKEALENLETYAKYLTKKFPLKHRIMALIIRIKRAIQRLFR